MSTRLENAGAPGAHLEGLGRLDAERAESMAAEGGRSAQVVSVASDSPGRRNQWVLYLSVAVLALAGAAVYRRLRLPTE